MSLIIYIIWFNLWVSWNYKILSTVGFPGGPVITNPPCNAVDAGSIPGRGTKIPHDCEQLIPRTTTKDPAWHKEGPTLLQLRLDAANQRPFKKYETHHSIYSWEKIVEFWTNLVCDLEQVTSPKPLAAAAASSLQSRLALCTLWTVVRQASLSMGFSRQECWSGLSYRDTIIIPLLTLFLHPV